MFDKLPSDLILHILDYTQKYKYNNCYLVSQRLNKLSTLKYERDMKELIKLNNNFKANNHIPICCSTFGSGFFSSFLGSGLFSSFFFLSGLFPPGPPSVTHKC